MSKIQFIVSLIFVIAASTIVNGQNCYKKKLCLESELKDYDYRSQSSYQTLTQGDTLNVGIVAYSMQSFRLVLCSDPKLGPLEIKVIYPQKITKKSIKEVKVNFEDPALNDTIWETNTVTEYETIFDNSNDKSKNYWEFSSRKTRLLILNVTAPEGKKGYTGCANILVGHKVLTSNKWKLR